MKYPVTYQFLQSQFSNLHWNQVKKKLHINFKKTLGMHCNTYIHTLFCSFIGNDDNK